MSMQPKHNPDYNSNLSIFNVTINVAEINSGKYN